MSDQEEWTLVTGGHVLTLDPELGELPSGEVLVRGDRIAQVAPRVDPPPDAPVTTIDAEGMVVIPGLVDNHRHLWLTLLRGHSADHRFPDYFREVLLGAAPRLTPRDMYLGVLLGALEALAAGTTTILDWNHGCGTLDHALMAVRALRESGVRARFGYASPAIERAADAAPSQDDVVEVDRALGDGGGLLSLALATRNPESEPDLGRVTRDITQARALAVPVTMHAGLGLGAGGSAAELLSAEGLLGPDLTFVHGNAFAPSDLALVAGAGAWISSSPEVEMQMGMGAAPIRAMREHGIRPTISVDGVAAASGSLFTQLRIGLQAQRLADNRDGREPLLPVSEVLPYVTSHAAASLGLADVGTLAPGSLADIALLDGRSLSTFLNPPAVTVLQAEPATVDTVLVAGRVVKRHGRLVTDLDLAGLRREAADARRRLLS